MSAGIIVFHGADHKCGTSMIAQCIAEKLASDRPDLRVLLAHTESASGDDYSPVLNESIERMMPYIADRVLDIEDTLERAKLSGNLWMIGGIGDVCAAASFHPDMTVYLLESLRRAFDVIICDSGSDVGSGAALGALLSADRLYMVISQSGSALARYRRFSLLYERLGLSIDAFIINRYDAAAVYDKKCICEKLGLDEEPVFTVRMSEHSERAELDSKSLINYRDGAFMKDIARLKAEIEHYG